MANKAHFKKAKYQRSRQPGGDPGTDRTVTISTVVALLCCYPAGHENFSMRIRTASALLLLLRVVGAM